MRVISRLAIWLPFAYYAFLYYNDQAGPQPADFLNKKFGAVGVILIVINLWIGALVSFLKPFPAKLRFLLRERRFLGVSSGIYLILHFVLYLLKEGLEWEAVTVIPEKFYLLMGILALSLITLLTITSNDWSLKKLGFKIWKNIHRLVYLAFALILFHVFLIEKADIPKYFLILALLVAGQSVRLFRFSKARWKKKNLESVGSTST